MNSVSEKLESFETLSFKDFCNELKKKRVKLSSSEKMDLLPLFEEKVEAIADISNSIKGKQIELDSLVFDIYDLNDNHRGYILNELSIEI